MQRTGIDRFVTELIDEICTANGLNPATNAKKGEREAAQSILMIALKRLRPQILAGCGVQPAPAQPKLVEVA